MKSHKLVKIILLVTAAVFILLVAGALFVWHSITSSFPSRSDFASQLQALHLAAAPPVSQTYSWGICLDNCPSMVATYKVPLVPLAAERVAVAADLRAAGYTVDQATDSQWVSGQKGTYGVTVMLDNSTSAGATPANVNELQVTLSSPPQ